MASRGGLLNLYLEHPRVSKHYDDQLVLAPVWKRERDSASALHIKSLFARRFVFLNETSCRLVFRASGRTKVVII